MKKILFLLIFVSIFFGGVSPYPQITDMSYAIEQRTSKSSYVDFVWYVKIQGVEKQHNMWLEFFLYDSTGDVLKKFGQMIPIKPKKLQEFNGRRMIDTDVIHRVSVRLGTLNKKY